MFSKNPLKGHSDLVVSLIAIPPALWLFIVAPQQAPGLYEDGVQPWLFPRVVLAFFIFLCVLLAVSSIWRRARHGETPGAPGAEEEAAAQELDIPARRLALLNLIVPAGLTILYLIGMIWIGYIYATAVIAFLYMLFLGASVRNTVLVVIGLAVVLHFGFGDLMNIPLPAGRLFE